MLVLAPRDEFGDRRDRPVPRCSGIFPKWKSIRTNSLLKSRRQVFDQLATAQGKRNLLRAALRDNDERDIAFRRMILSIPAGKVSTYGRVAAAAGYPQLHRAVARLLRIDAVDQLPWHRVVGAGGEIKLRGAGLREQRERLQMEGVEFSRKRVDMERFEHIFEPWNVYK